MSGNALIDNGLIVNGGLQFGNFTNGLLQVDGSGNVSTSSAQGLALGQAQGATPWFDGSNWQFNTNLYNNNGNIGIGTSAPSQKLEVSGNALIDNALVVNGNVQLANYTNGFLTVDGSGNLGISNTGNLLGNGNSAGVTPYWDGSQWVVSSANIYNNGGNVGVGTNTPNSVLQVAGSVSVPYSVVNNSGTYTLTASDHTIRRFGNVNNIVVPDPGTCLGREYTIISSNGTGSNVGISPAAGTVYDDVNNETITYLTPNQRITIQSDGSNWIVIGR